MKNIKLIIEYDGTRYKGWQRQKNGISIQQVIEETLESLTKEKINLIGSSRTDSGVHAKGFTANFLTDSSIPAERFYLALNTKLPPDIVILSSEEVDSGFNSRYDSLGKTYCYNIMNRRLPPAINRDYLFLVKPELDLDLMREAAGYFIGKHDFSAFKSTGGSVKTSIRTISELYIIRKDEILSIYVTADGFLYNMVRIIVGTLIEVGLKKLSPEAIPDIIASKNRERAGDSAPAKGLCLYKVYY